MKLADTGLRKQPFRTHGKPVVLVPYAAHRKAIRFLDETRANAHGLGLFHGPPLSGKTTIVRQFAESLPSDHAAAVVDGARSNPASLLQQILLQYGYDEGVETVSERFNLLRVIAMQQAATGRPPVLVVENVDRMTPVMLEILCELAEMSFNGTDALRIILVSDRPMLPIVKAPAMQSIENRLTGKFLLMPMTRAETASYAHSKLRSGGCDDPTAVMPAAVCNRLHSTSGGWPGVVERLAIMAIANAEHIPLLVEHIPEKFRHPNGPDGVAAAQPHLILTYRHRTLKKIRLDKPRHLVGRNELCDIDIVHEWVSRHHAMIVRNDRSTVIVDLDSRNGTFVNGQRITSHVLVNNDIIMLGDHRLKFMDASATRRMSLRAAGWDDVKLGESIRKFHKGLVRRRSARALPIRRES